jgi:tRNA(Ile)-lysidine synthase
MDATFDRVRQFVRQHDLIRPDSRVIAAVSGGSDSVALAYLLRDLDAAGDLRLVGLAHFNHQLRREADADERFAVSVATALDRPIAIDRDDVAARAGREHRSLEDAARASRHEFFDRARLASGADLVAVGHTRDDQAETFLLRLVRGAGFRGLAGMHPRNAHIVRPLLACRRDELRRWLLEHGVSFVEDASNQDVSIPRNRVRAELLPLLESRFNPGAADVLADEAELARDAADWMDAAAAEASARVVRAADDGTEIDTVALAALPLALRRLVVWRALSAVAATRPIAFGHVEAVLRLSPQTGARVDLPGQRAERIADRIVLKGRPAGTIGRWAPDEPPEANLFQYSLSIPGEVVLKEAGCRLLAGAPANRQDRQPASAMMGNGPVAMVRRDSLGGVLSVRNRRPGDRFRPIGLDGQKKLQDFFVDRKIARESRDLVPLVVDQADRIVWVAGHGIDEAFRVTDPAQEVLILELKALGGSA